MVYMYLKQRSTRLFLRSADLWTNLNPYNTGMIYSSQANVQFIRLFIYLI